MREHARGRCSEVKRYNILHNITSVLLLFSSFFYYFYYGFIHQLSSSFFFSFALCAKRLDGAHMDFTERADADLNYNELNYVIFIVCVLSHVILPVCCRVKTVSCAEKALFRG